MLEQWLSIAFGTGLTVTAGLLFAREWRVWQRANAALLTTDIRSETTTEDEPTEHVARGPASGESTDRDRRLDISKARRRLQVAVLLGLVGLMIALGDAGLIAWEQHLVAFVWYWIAVILLTLWMAGLACADLLIHRLLARSARGSLARLEEKRSELLAAADRLREHREGRHPHSN